MKKRHFFTIIIALVMTVMLGTMSVTAETVYDPGRVLWDSTGTNPTYTFGESNSAAYEVQAYNNSSATVTVIIEAGDALTGTFWDFDLAGVTGTDFYFTGQYTVNDGDTTDGIGVTVRDLLTAVQNDTTNGLTLSFVSTNNYMTAISYDGNDWTEGNGLFDGWVFLVNGLFPVHEVTYNNATHYQGTSITQTPIKSGDVIHFFFDNPATIDPNNDDYSCAAIFVRGDVLVSEENDVEIQLQGTRKHIDQTISYTPIYLYDYEDLENNVLTGDLYNSTNPAKSSALDVTDIKGTLTPVSGGSSISAFADDDGLLSFNNVPAGTYTFTTNSVLRDWEDSTDFMGLYFFDDGSGAMPYFNAVSCDPVEIVVTATN